MVAMIFRIPILTIILPYIFFRERTDMLKINSVIPLAIPRSFKRLPEKNSLKNIVKKDKTRIVKLI